VLPSIPKVKEFAEEIGRTGMWHGEALEGFVVRTTVVHSQAPLTDGRRAHANDASPPYPPGSSFFFKIKFDEPYMMYRDWREITKKLLSRGENAKLPQNKMKRSETRTYVEWVRREIQDHPELFEGYAKGRGIIATRDRFLEWLETEEGKAGKKKAETEEVKPTGRAFGKTVIMPIAVPGVGSSRSPST
jgi:tRNA ligase